MTFCVYFKAPETREQKGMDTSLDGSESSFDLADKRMDSEDSALRSISITPKHRDSSPLCARREENTRNSVEVHAVVPKTPDAVDVKKNSVQQNLYDIFHVTPPKGVTDLYAYARRYIKIYSEQEIKQANGLLRKEYLKYWNKTALEAIKLSKRKSEIEAYIQKKWNTTGRYDSFISLGWQLGEIHETLSVDWDSKYKKHYSESLDAFQEIENKMESILKEKEQRIMKGHLSRRDREHLDEHLLSLKAEKAKVEETMGKISRNWSNRIGSVAKNGPEKRKPGRKPKSTKDIDIRDVAFKSARDLKRKHDPQRKVHAKRRIIPIEPSESDSDGENRAVLVEEDPISDGAVTPIVVTSDEERDLEDNVIMNCPDINYNSDGLCLLKPNISQHSADGFGASSCMGFCLRLAQIFMEGDLVLPEEGDPDCIHFQHQMLQNMAEAVSFAKDYWRENKLGCMSAQLALNLPCFYLNYCQKEHFWLTELGVGFSV